MNYSIPLHAVIANRKWEGALFQRSLSAARQGFRAVWTFNGAEHDIGAITAFNGNTSFSGTHAVITIAWPDDKNPRTGGNWWQLLAPDDTARVKVYLTHRNGPNGMEAPLMLGVPIPDGTSETYGGGRETIDLRLEDITGAAGRKRNYPAPSTLAPTIDARSAASTILGDIPFVCTYPLDPVDSCLERYPNALMAADNILIAQQDKLNPLAGQKRIRYGDRDGKIVYRLIEDPATGAPFTKRFPANAHDFQYTGAHILGGLTVEPRHIHFTATRINPYLDLGSRIRIVYPRAALDEIVEIIDMGWRSPDLVALKCRRQFTL
ncbi:MAG: hypothetical protein HZA04_06100 [Nitrospinae bacterium]|nr:hypothetical protein [Nitrospinota bacterium]